MTAYDIMQRLKSRYAQEKDLQQLLEIRRGAVTNVTASYGEHGPPGGAETDKMAAYVARADDILTRQKYLKLVWQEETRYCAALCEKLSGFERSVLYCYYCRDWTVAAVARTEGYSARYAANVKSKVDAFLRETDIKSGDLSPSYDEWIRLMEGE